jgi:cell division protein FtsQ
MIAQGLVERLRLRGAARRPARRPGAGARTVIRRRRLGRRARLAMLTSVAVALLLFGAWTWFADSPLVSVDHVTVSGQSGPDAGHINAALESAARTMSTLDVQISRLRRAVAPYPIVRDVRVTTQFPHGMRIEVIERQAVGVIDAGGRRVAVAPDGTLMHDVVASASLPSIPMSLTPVGMRVTGGSAGDAIKLLAAAPSELLGKLSQVTTVATHGLVAQVRGGPSIYFGDPTDLAAKWIAASEVLADPSSAGALYIDVTDPMRPAAGADSQSSTAAPPISPTTAGSTGSSAPPSSTTGG